ncbi:MAG: GDSL family lipase [Ignavibacteriales bacterium]|nr:GDSL family lipase [Ignavibacteriales bacterium]
MFLYTGTLFSQTDYDSLYLKNPQYKNLTALYDLSKIEKADIVFLGNSITFGGNWSELLGRERVVNRGIGSDNIPGMLQRLSQVARLNPKLCFIMAGINDLYQDVPVDTVFKRYVLLVDSLRAYDIIPILQSTLHVNPKWKRAEVKNLEVAKLNRLLQKYATDRSLVFLDLNSVLSENGVLKNEYTTDGVHLTAAAYQIWRDQIDLVVKKYGW